ncbi:MAG: hypothetical protein M3P51_13260 [Chloroflexota bacterium]|nr:hypothetical protein [Chloroflexota bacterium]
MAVGQKLTKWTWMMDNVAANHLVGCVEELADCTRRFFANLSSRPALQATT